MTMLKTHLQPIVAYFWNLNRATASQQNLTARQNATGNLHSRFVLDYLADCPEPVPSHNFFSRLWQSLFEVNTDPKITERADRHGQRYWEVYDPVTQRHHRFTEEEAVYEWLEQRYYQAPAVTSNAYAVERGY